MNREPQAVRKPYQDNRKPTPVQERERERVLWACRPRSTGALEHRSTAWQRRRVAVSRDQQEAELQDIRAAFPDDAGSHAHVLHDARARIDKTQPAFLRRLRRHQRGEQAGCPRCKPATRSTSLTYKEQGNGVMLDKGFVVRAQSGRSAVRWSRPSAGAPTTVTISREADGWYVCCSCAAVPTHPLPASGQETGIDLGSEAFATLADGTRIVHPGWQRNAERALKTAHRRVARRTRGSNRRRTAVTLLAKAHQTVRRQRRDLHHTTARARVREHDTIDHDA